MSEIIRKLAGLRYKKRLLLVIALLAIILGFILFSSYGVVTRVKLTSDKQKKYEELKNLIMQNDSLRNVIKDMKSDTTEIERLAREKYGMIKKGEKVYIKSNTDDD
jgi:cell division protein FtsB